MRSVAPITKILPQFLWSAKMPKIYAKCQKSMQKTWNFIFCHLNLVRAVYYLSFKLLVRSVAPLTKILPPFLWFGGVYVTNRERFAMVIELDPILLLMASSDRPTTNIRTTYATLARPIWQWQCFRKVQLLVPARKNVRFNVFKHPINFFPIFFAFLTSFRPPQNFAYFSIFRLFALPSKQP